MTDRLDEAIREWVWREYRRRDRPPFDHKGRHLQLCKTTIVAKCNHEVKCECYSEYTRDDRWMIEVWLHCACGVEMKWRWEPEYGQELPDIIEGIREVDEELAECEYDDE